MLHALKHTLISLLLLNACGDRSAPLPTADAGPLASQSELEKLRQRKEEDQRALAGERKTTDEKVAELQQTIDSLSKELSSSQNMTLEDRKKLQAQLEATQKEKQAAEQRLAELKANQKRIEDELAAAKTTAQNQQQSTTVATTSGTITNPSNGVATTSGTTTPSNTTPATSSTPGTLNPTSIPAVGTIFSCATAVTSLDGATRLQASFIGRDIPYVVQWIDPAGKVVTTATINAGATTLINTTLGHAFQLMSVDGKTCYGKARIGNANNAFLVR